MLSNSRMFLFGSIFIIHIFSLIDCNERGHRVRRIVGGFPADVPPVDDPTVFTHFAGKTALVQGIRDFPHYVFKGIKYAHPPTGKNRFLRPRQKFLEGNIDATKNPPPCIQPRPGTNMVIGSEDCLALNVFTPELPTGSEGLPVVVWIHGGGFRYGSASQYGVRHLVGKQLVVVTIQYRLGSLGFLSDGTKQLPGNVALWDMLLAVQWVRNYIGFFGGNPYRIVVMGHDTGASSALLIALSKVAKGLTSGIVAMSGTAVSRWAVDHAPQNTARDIAKQNGCPVVNALTMVKCLQSLPPDSIIVGDSNVEFQRIQSRGFMSGLSGDLGSAPVTEGFDDGRSLPGVVQDEPMNDLEKQRNPKIPLLTGIVKDETKKAVRGYMRGDILHKLKTIPDFLDKVLLKNLKQFIPLKLDIASSINNLEKSLKNLLPINFKNYLKHNAENIFETLDKIADVTNDALFNVPAFLTVDRWSKNGAPTFLYSFEHVGKLKKGSSFLLGSPLIGNITNIEEESNDTVGHGDDLAYLFDAYDIDGKPLDIESNLTEDDKNVREFFTQMVADFARHGAPRMNNKNLSPFSSAKNNFLQIRAKPLLAEGFKFCEMALWCNIAERLKSTGCAFLNALDNVGSVVTGLLNNTGLNNLAPDNVFKQISKPSLNALGIGPEKKAEVMNFLNGGKTNQLLPDLLAGANKNPLQNTLNFMGGQKNDRNQNRHNVSLEKFGIETKNKPSGTVQNQVSPNLLVGGGNKNPLSPLLDTNSERKQTPLDFSGGKTTESKQGQQNLPEAGIGTETIPSGNNLNVNKYIGGSTNDIENKLDTEGTNHHLEESVNKVFGVGGTNQDNGGNTRGNEGYFSHSGGKSNSDVGSMRNPPASSNWGMGMFGSRNSNKNQGILNLGVGANMLESRNKKPAFSLGGIIG